MKTKPDIKKIIEKIKGSAKPEEKPAPRPMRIDIDYTKPQRRERDMKQEAMDLGSHGAKEYFGGNNARPV